MNHRNARFSLAIFLISAWSVTAADLTLIDAVKHSDIHAVRSLLAAHANVNAAAPDGSTALHWAARLDNLPIADLLIAAGADVKARTPYNITPLALASTNGDAAMLERLIQAGADPNGTSEDGQTALMTAARTGKPEALKVLLTHGARVNAAEPRKGQTALMWAAAEGNAAAEELLIEFGAGVKAKSKAGFTPLLFAVRNGHIEAAKMLLEHGANVNDVAPDGASALNMAVVNAYFELAAVLLDRGADPNAPDPRGSALHTLAWLRRPGSDGAAGVGNTPHGPPPPTGNLTALELAQKLLEHGANPNIRIDWEEKKFDKEGGTMRNPPLIQLGRHYLTYVGATPFYIAAHNGDAAYMRLLAQHGADPKIPNVLGVTPLMVAAGLDYWEGEAPGPYTGCSEAERLEAVKLALGHSLGWHRLAPQLMPGHLFRACPLRRAGGSGARRRPAIG
ncbi:MAG TPA: ankyrin repeat domain-containing protein [Bryobacteraceae bacterium]|nr:ankyrin repeat domain-containing protein [Bryobacteraceae bacterium]